MTLAFLMFAVIFSTDRIDEPTDMIELNHIYSTNGQQFFSQIIFWKWYEDEGRYHARDFKLLESGDIDIRRTKDGKVVEFRWFNRDQKVHRVVRSEHFRESWTQHDPERLDKEQLRESMRVRLASKFAPIPAAPEILEVPYDCPEPIGEILPPPAPN